jgi:hypothetical protein
VKKMKIQTSKHKIQNLLIVLAIFWGAIFALPAATNAFWPFDLFKKGSASTSQIPPLIQKIIEKFKLNPSEVQKVIDEERQERERQRLSLLEEKLNQAVKDGVISEEQKRVLLERWQKRWQERWQIREEERKWFEENKIDWQKLRPYLGGMVGKGFGKRGFGRGF